MKKVFALTLALVLGLSTLTACSSNEPVEEETTPVDLTAFYEELAENYEWDEFTMANVEGEMLELTYPGLSELMPNQLIAKMPMMSAVVSELVLLECTDEETALAAAQLLQERVTMQAQGGAWYPESMEAWEKGEVIQSGNYVAMIAVAEHQDEISQKFQDLFK